MGTKKEIYYKFIFPDYNNLSISNKAALYESTHNGQYFVPDSDDEDQKSEVRALCNDCPERVITYDQLKEQDPNNLIPIYKTAWETNRPSTQPYTRTFIKGCVDEYIKKPKYFDLRNYWDLQDITQAGGMSLMIADSPELGGDYSGYTKFSYGGKTVYCSMMISSGDFFYEFCLPEEVLAKSKLRDKIVFERFHKNWYFDDLQKRVVNIISKAGSLANAAEPANYPEWAPDSSGNYNVSNPAAGGEKRVFAQHYFKWAGIQFGESKNTFGYAYWIDADGKTYDYTEIAFKKPDGGIIAGYSDSAPIIPDCTDAIYSYVLVTEIRTVKRNYDTNGNLTSISYNTNILVDDSGNPTTKYIQVQEIPINNNYGYVLKSDTTKFLKRYKFIYYNKNNVAEEFAFKISGFTPNANSYPNGNTHVRTKRVFAVEQLSSVSEDLKRDFINLEATRRILYYYNGTQLKYNNNAPVTIQQTDDIPIISKPLSSDYFTRVNAAYPTRLNGASHPIGNMTLTEAKNILDNYVKSQSNFEFTGSNTALSYEPPDIYKLPNGCPPLQIPYNLLRYAMNDRPPFTDCETVLVMWIADKDPMSSDITSVADLHNQCNFQQYAIPISCRCCFKNTNDNDSFIQSHQGSHKHIHNRFLVDYPHYWSFTYRQEDTLRSNPITKWSYLTYRYHTHRSEFYNKSDFKEVLFLPDLIHYSNDYIVSYQNTSFINKGFDIQGYLLKNYESKFRKLYCLKTFLNPYIDPNVPSMNSASKGQSNNFGGEFYYIRINKTTTSNQNIFNINTGNYNINTNRRICICKNTQNSTDPFIPSNYVYRKNINGGKWYDNGQIPPSGDVYIVDHTEHFGFDDVGYYQEYGYNDWKINDNTFITLFDASSFTKLENYTLTLTGHSSLRTALGDLNEFYISSLGVSKDNLIYVHSIFRSGDWDPAGEFSPCYPLGILDNHIVLNDVTYGSQVQSGGGAHKVVIGFADMLDFTQDDLYHFKWDGSEYKPVKIVYNEQNKAVSIVQRNTNYTVTAYVMNYS